MFIVVYNVKEQLMWVNVDSIVLLPSLLLLLSAAGSLRVF